MRSPPRSCSLSALGLQPSRKRPARRESEAEVTKVSSCKLWVRLWDFTAVPCSAPLPAATSRGCSGPFRTANLGTRGPKDELLSPTLSRVASGRPWDPSKLLAKARRSPALCTRSPTCSHTPSACRAQAPSLRKEGDIVFNRSRLSWALGSLAECHLIARELGSPLCSCSHRPPPPRTAASFLKQDLHEKEAYDEFITSPPLGRPCTKAVLAKSLETSPASWLVRSPLFSHPSSLHVSETLQAKEMTPHRRQK